MRRLTLKELLAVTATTDQGLKSLRRRDQIALAFGRRGAYESLSYVEADAVGIMLTETLGKTYEQTEAAQLVRLFGDTWLEVIAEAEANPDGDAHFCIVDFERDSDGKRAHMACGARQAAPEHIATEVSRTPQAAGFRAIRINCCNLSHLIRFIRKTAARHGIDLSRPFLPPPNSPELAALLAPYVETRDSAIVAVRDRKRRETLASKAGEQARRIAETMA